jgi:hypothetical protein
MKELVSCPICASSTKAFLDDLQHLCRYECDHCSTFRMTAQCKEAVEALADKDWHRALSEYTRTAANSGSSEVLTAGNWWALARPFLKQRDKVDD